jgi:hypothetical protein
MPLAGQSAQVTVKDKEQPMSPEIFQPVRPAFGIRKRERDGGFAGQIHFYIFSPLRVNSTTNI